MKNILKFEGFVKENYEIKEELNVTEPKSSEDLIKQLSELQNVYDLNDLKSMNDTQLKNLYSEVLNAKEEDSESEIEPTSELEYESRRWIQDAIKRPGSLRRKLHKKKGEKITSDEIDSELQALRGRDRDKKKPGLQLSKRDRSKHRQLTLAKTLRNMK